MDTALSPPVGQLLGGRYQVSSRIARGGMATVYLGTDTRLDRVIAIKIAHPELSDDAQFVRRFIGEARSAALLSSPNVVAVYDQGSDGPLHYIAMEYVAGRTLRELLTERGRLGARETLDVMAGVLSGLAAAHQAGFAHRDVKPENVLLTAAGGVKVADFGLARSVAGLVHTKGGMIIGTAAYLAPEQVSGGTSDARTDVYAAGVMMFELLTGVQPHTGESPLAVAHKHVNDYVPAPSSIQPGLSPSLDTLVAMATSRDPDLRPANAGQFLRAIQEVRNGQTLPGIAPYSAPGSAMPRAASYSGDNWEPGSGLIVAGASALPSLGPQSSSDRLLPAPAAGLSPAVNHTLIVPSGGLPTDYPPSLGRAGGADYASGTGYANGAGYSDGAGRYPSRRAASRRSEPWLQRWLFSRQFIYLSGGLALVVAAALIGWWLTSGQYSTIPPLRGVVLSTARTELKTLDLHGQLGRGQHSSLAKGDVISTRPAIGSKVTTGSTVTIIVSLGPVFLQVPDVSGQPLSQAEAALRQAHLIPGAVSKTVSSSVPVGDVIFTTPHAYSSWPQSQSVGLTESEGPGLPNFAGLLVSAAQATAAAGGYTINAVANPTGNQPVNTITRQVPPPNTPITPNEVVTVYFSPGPPTVPVPNVQGLPLHDAIKALQEAGFQWTVSDSGVGNHICSYSPTTPQPKGTVITLNIGGLFCGF